MSSKIFEIFRNLKSDAVPKAPRDESSDVNNGFSEMLNEDPSSNNQDEVINEPQYKKKKDKKAKKEKKEFFGSSTKRDKSDVYDLPNNASTVNTQATGNVINIVSSNNVRWGNEYVYYMTPTGAQRQKQSSDEEQIEKCYLITEIMEAKIKPDHEYIDYISKNLGKNWHSIFRALGYTKGRIETVEIDEARNGVSEARYKLLLDWIRNDDDGTLGRLVTILWEEDERQIVKELALLYEKNKK